MVVERVQDIGDSRWLSREELEVGIDVLTKIIDETRKDLGEAYWCFNEKPLQEKEYQSLIKTYDLAIVRAERMRHDYQKEFGLR